VAQIWCYSAFFSVNGDVEGAGHVRQTNVLPGLEGVLLLSSLHVGALWDGKPSRGSRAGARGGRVLFPAPNNGAPPRAPLPQALRCLPSTPVRRRLPPHRPAAASAAARRKPQGPHLSRPPSPFREPLVSLVVFAVVKGTEGIPGDSRVTVHDGLLG
jgi:hypothetical protein